MDNHTYAEEEPILIPEEVYIKICDYINEDVYLFGIS